MVEFISPKSSLVVSLRIQTQYSDGQGKLNVYEFSDYPEL